MIGVFDSGFGGRTVLRSLGDRVPQYDYLYLGDSARAPYGARSLQVVHEFTREAVELLFERGCPLVLLACNTASAQALRTLQSASSQKSSTSLSGYASETSSSPAGARRAGPG